MYRFYVEENQIENGMVTVTGSDVNHIKNVLRMKCGEEIIICNGQGKDFYCIIDSISGEKITAGIKEENITGTELDSRIYLFQGLPKKDKMELIIQKAVELGVYEIIPVLTRRTVVRLDDKKKEARKLERWQSIASGAAKQSGRGIIPQVLEAVTFKEALAMAAHLEYTLIPYEHARGMAETKQKIGQAVKHKSIGIFIGPEGGFEDGEITSAMEAGAQPVTLGKRILRTETAGLTMLSIIMFELENDR